MKRRRRVIAMTHPLRMLMGGTRSQHPMHFTVDRPRGLGSFLLLRFYVPVVVRMPDGEQHAAPGDCLLFDPRFPQWYVGHGTGLCDDWLHFDGPQARQLIAASKLPLNRVFSVREHECVPHFIEEMRREMAFRQSHWEQMVDLRLRELLLRLGRQQCDESKVAMTSALAAHLADLRAVRLQLQKEFSKRWTIATMARMGHLSASRFFALYSRFFGVSPLEDLIRARLAWARVLLSSDAASVKEVAGSCGFRNAYYFSRIFKKRVGCPPSQYARCRPRIADRA